MFVEELCKNCNTIFPALPTSGRVFCCPECKKEYEERQQMSAFDRYIANYNRAMESNSKVGRAAVEARAKGMSYGQYMARKVVTAGE